jgi:hypothetical protein
MNTPSNPSPSEGSETGAEDAVDQGDAGGRSARMVRELLERHGLPKHRHASFVAEFFGLSRGAAHQRIAGNSAWTLDDYMALTERFGETFTGTGATAGGGISAVIRLGALQVPCRIWLATNATASAQALPWALVAMESGGSYAVVPRTAAAEESGLPLARVEITNGAAALPRVAVCANLRGAGVDARAYSSQETLLADLAKEPFDGYVIDWLLPSGQNTMPLLKAIRGQASRSALVLLTGKTREGSADPMEVGAAVRDFRAQLVEKPVQPPLLMSALLNDGLAASPRVPEADT